jgi:hypothetical protein
MGAYVEEAPDLIWCCTKHSYKTINEEDPDQDIFPRREWLLKVMDGTPLTVSPSSMSTFIGSGRNKSCKRKWWLNKVRGLRGKQRKAQAFGTCLHSVAERYLSADSLGRDVKTGQPVDCYPEGWEIPEEKFGSEGADPLSTLEQSALQQVFQAAVDAGVVRRQHGGVAELEVREEITVVSVECRECAGKGEVYAKGDHPIPTAGPCPMCGGAGTRNIKVSFWGDVDYASPHGIEDHKTTKDKKWLKKSKDLAEDVPMLMYAFMVKLFGQDESEWPETVELRHNQFIIPRDRDGKLKGKLNVTEATATVPTVKVAHFWVTKILPAIEEMVRLRENTRCAFDIPEPCNQAVCDEYGGCDFEDICNGKINEETFQERFEISCKVDKLSIPQHTKTTPQTEGNTRMGIFSKAKGDQTGNASPAGEQAAPAAGGKGIFAGADKTSPTTPAQTTPEAAPTPKPEPEAAPATVKQLGKAPWHNEQCTACASNSILGFNTKGGPCRICDKFQRDAQDIESKDYTIAVEGNRVTWTPTSDRATSAEAAAAGICEGFVEDTEAPVVTPEPVAAEPAAPAATEPVAQEPAATTPATEPGTLPQTGVVEKKAKDKITLFVNCIPLKGMAGSGKKAPQDAFVLFENAKAAIAAHYGADHFFNLDPFKRRDAIVAYAPNVVAEILGGTIVAVQVGTGATDYNTFVESLMPHADMVVRGVN